MERRYFAAERPELSAQWRLGASRPSRLAGTHDVVAAMAMSMQNAPLILESKRPVLDNPVKLQENAYT